MANKKIQATAQLFLNTKDAQKDAKKFVEDLKQRLTDIESAADKMTVFKDMVDYIAQVDRAMTNLKKHNKDVFGHMFDGIDKNLKSQLETLFGVSGEHLEKIDVLRERLKTLTPKSSIKEVRDFAEEINNIFSSLGVSTPFNNVAEQFSGKTNVGHIELLTNALANFATVWKDVNSNLAGNFGFGDNALNLGGGDLTSEIQILIDNIEEKNKELLEAKERFDKILSEFNNINKNGISDNYKIELTEESVKNLTLEYDRLQAELESADASSQDFYNKLTNLIEISLKLKKAFSDISVDDGLKKVFQNASAGTGTGEATLYGLLSRYARTKDPMNKDIQNILGRGDLQNVIADNSALIAELKTSNDINAVIQKRVDLYDKLRAKLHEYNVEQNKEFDTDEEEDASFRKLERIEKEVAKLTGAAKRLDDIQNVMADLSEDGAVLDDVLQKLYKTLGMETPDTFRERLEALVAESKAAAAAIEESGFGTGGQGGSGSGTGKGFGSGNSVTAEVDFTSLENTIKSEASAIVDKLDSGTLKVEIVKDQTKDIQGTINDILGAVQRMSDNTIADVNNVAVNNMKKNLLQLLDVVNTHNVQRDAVGNHQSQELGITLMSDGSFSVNYGKDGGVSWNNVAESLVANLNKTLLGDFHSHPLEDFFGGNGQFYVSDSFSGSEGDFGSFRFSKALGAEVAGMITGNILRVLDLSSIAPDVLARVHTELAKVEKEYIASGAYSEYISAIPGGGIGYSQQSTLEGQHKVTEIFESMMYEAFKNVGYSQDDIDNKIFKKYNLTDDAQLTELAGRLVQLVSSAEQAIPPVDRLADIILQFGGNAIGKDADVLFDAYNKGELKASDVFNKLVPNHNVNEAAIQSLLNINNAAQISPIETVLSNISSTLSNISTIVGNIEFNTKPNGENQLNNAIGDLLDLQAGIVNNNLTRDIPSIYNSQDTTKYRYDDVENRAFLAVEKFRDSFLEQMNRTTSPDLKDASALIDKFKTALKYVQDLDKQTQLHAGRPDELGLYTSPETGDVLLGYDRLYHSLTEDLDPLIQQLMFIKDQSFVSSEDVEKQQLQLSLDKLYAAIDSLSSIISNSTGTPLERKVIAQSDVFDNVQPGTTREVSEDISNLDALLGKVQEVTAEIRGLATEVSGIIENISNPFNKSKGANLTSSLEIDDEISQIGAIYDSEDDVAKKSIDDFALFYKQYTELRSKMSGDSDFIFDAFDPDDDAKQKILDALEQIKQKNLEIANSDLGTEEEIKKVRELKAEVIGLQDLLKKGWMYGSSVDEYQSVYGVNDADAKLLHDLIEGSNLYNIESEIYTEYTDKEADVYSKVSSRFADIMSDVSSKMNEFLLSHADTLLKDTSTDAELSPLDKLRSQLVEVKEAVEAKTAAFEQEGRMVDSVVNAEIVSLQALIDKLSEVVAQTNLVSDAFNNIDTNIPKIEVGAKPVEQSTSTEKTHYVTDPQGRPVTMYRGIRNSYSGLVSNRYHGGTFSTDNLELAKEYAGELGKVEKVLLSMKNPLEIDGHGAFWNKIEYIGDNSDEASQKLYELNASIRATEKLLRDAEKIPVSEQELKNISRGLISEDDTKRAREISYWAKELKQYKSEKAAILADTSNPYGRKNTNELVEIAKAKGYDGVIFKDIIDSATGDVKDLSTVMVTFEQDQIHYLETISSTFESSVTALKNHFGDLTQHISASSEEVESSIRKMVELRGKVNAGEISEDEYRAFISENAIARDYEKLAKKSMAVPDFITGALDGEEFELKHVIQMINDMLDNMRHRAQKIAKTFGKEGVPFDELLKTNAVEDTATVVTTADTVDDTDNVSNEITQLERLQVVLGEVKNAVLAKTKAFYDEGSVVGQVVGKEVAALNKLLETINEIVPKVDALSTKMAGVGPIDLVAQSGGNNTDATAPSTKTEDKFQTRVSAKKGAMTKYIDELQGVQYVTDDTREKLVGLRDAMDTVKTPKDLDDIIAKFEALQTRISILKASFEDTGLAPIRGAKNNLLSSFKTLNEDQQYKVSDDLDEAIIQLNTYENMVLNGQKVALSAIHETTKALREQIERYKEDNKEAKKLGVSAGGNASFGSTASINAAAKYNSLTRAATSDQFANSSEVANALALYEQSYKRLIERRDELRAKDVIDDSDREAFKATTTECNNYAKALEKIINSSLKLKGNKANVDDYMLGADFDYSNMESRKAALADFAKQMYGVDVAATDFKDNWNKVVFAVQNGDGTFTQMTATFTDARNEIVAMAGDTKKVQTAFSSFIDGFKGRVKSLSQYFLATISIYDAWRVIKQGVQYVREIDSALTELKKVTDETDASYANFLQDMSKTGAVIGATVKDLTSSAADWARLGYDMQQAGELAKNTSILMNVSEFDDVSKATDTLISSLQAFKKEGQDVGTFSMEIIDKYNEVGNNYAISTSDLAESLTRSSAALVAANNSLEESIAMTTAANTTIQDPESVGNALKVVSMRIRGVKTELAEAGEDTEGMVENTAKLQEKIMALTNIDGKGGIDILTNTGEFKSTYDILLAISKVWKEMDDASQAALLELVAGKTRGSVVAALFQNGDVLEKAYESASSASGSAMNELNTYLDSIQGRIDLFNNSVQTMWMNFIDSDVVKFIIDLGTGLIKLVDKVGLLQTALAGVLTYFNISSKSKLDFVSMLGIHDTEGGWFAKIKTQAVEANQSANTLFSTLNKIQNVPLTMSSDIEMASQVDLLNKKWSEGQESFVNYVSTLGDADIALKAYAASVKDGNYSLAGFQQFIQQHNAGLKASGIAAKAAAIGHQLLNAAISMGISLLISSAISAITKWANANEEAAKAAREAADASQELREQADALEDYKEQIVELRKELDRNVLSESDAYDAREKLLTIQDELIEKFSLEKAGINLVTGAINDQIAAIDELSKKEAQQWINSNQKAINEAIQYFEDDARGGNLDPWYEGPGTRIDMWGQTENVISMIEKYADAHDHIRAEDGALIPGDQSISFTGSVEEVKTAVEDFATWLEAKENELLKKKTALLALPDQTDDVKSQIASIEKDIEQLQDVREDLGTEYTNWFGDGSSYATNKALIEETQRNTALTQYTDQYMKILQAQNDLEEAQLKGDTDGVSAALAVINEETAAAATTAQNNGQNYMVSFFNGIQEGYKSLSGKIQLETDLSTDVLYGQTGKSVKDIISEALDYYDGMNLQEIIQRWKMGEINNAAFAALRSVAEFYGMTMEELGDALAQLGYIQDGFAQKVERVNVTLKTYSALSESVANYNEVLSQTKEVVTDNTKVTEEYKESLVALGISESDLNECFDDSNKLVVKNANALHALVQDAKKSTAQNIKLAKSQARLEYYEKYKELLKLTNGQKIANAATLSQVKTLYAEMTALQKTIAKYSMLEHQLLGATNAYEEFAKAQEIDAANDYESKAEELVGYLVDAFHTAKLGSESAQAAIKGLVPESVYADLDTLDEKMDAVYKYFTTDLSKYFYVKFNDDGSLESAEMLIDNVKKFVEDGIANGVFTGSWEEWDLDERINGIDELAEKMNVTKEMAYAFLQAMETYDISWIGGDASTLLDKLIPSSAELQKFGDQMQATFEAMGLDKDIDLTQRVKISREVMSDKGWDIGDEESATAFGMTMAASDLGLVDENGHNYFINVTPQLPDGTVIEQGKFKDWIQEQLASGKTLEDLDIVLGKYSSFEDAKRGLTELYDMQKDYYNMVQSYSLENEIYANTQKQVELQYKIGTGEITADTVVGADGKTTAGEQLTQLNKDAEATSQAARKNATEWTEASKAYEGAKDNVDDLNKKLAAATDEAEIDELQGQLGIAEKALWDTYVALVKCGEPTEVTLTFAKEQVQRDLENVKATMNDTELNIVSQLNIDTLEKDSNGNWIVNIDAYANLDDSSKARIQEYLDYLAEEHNINILQGEGAVTTLDVLTEIKDILSKTYEIMVNTSDAQTKTQSFADLWNSISDKGVTLWTNFKQGITDYFTRTPDEGDGTSANGTVHVNGTARANGSFGAPKTETALVGELGPELLVRDGRWTTIGDNGAEFTQIKKGDIIFNHRQTKDLLSKGYVTGRGKLQGGLSAFAGGTAYAVHPWTGGMNIDDDWQNITPTIWNDATNGEYLKDETKSLSDALGDAADSVNEFEETIDWIEIRMEEFDERIGKLNAELENQTTYAQKNSKIDAIIVENQKKYADSLAGAAYYENYAQKYLEGMNDDLVSAAKNGAIAITEFTKEQDEATVNAIQNYRDYAQKAADLRQQAEEILTEIRDSVIQKIDNIQSYGDVKTSIEDLQTEKLQNMVDYWETKGEIPASAYYGVNGGNAANSTGMFENSYKKIDYWTPLLKDMQAEFNEAVQKGQIIVGSIEWYEQLEKLYQVQAEIDAATIEIEEFQNEVNDLYWDNFDQLINRLDYLKDETQSLIDLMDHADMVTKPDGKTYKDGTVKFWTADDVEWTDEGLASLGLYAQQMEIAEYQSKQYAKAIDDLTAEYKAGHYSENEYIEKLNELKSAQYDSIEAYHDAQDAIKQLNETRIDAIKEGIEKEIEAYEELIDKKREELSAEQDLYDFQKSTMEQQKNIADIQRKIAALSGDNSASAVAKRKQLEAELLEAQADLEESYYDRSIENQQNALDKELEDFQTQKDAEIQKWEEYLDNIEQVVTDSLNVVQANATDIGATLTDKANEYNLTVSDAILTPWKDGSLAVSDYQTTFDTAMSSTMDQLEALKVKWQEVIDKMAEYGNAQVDAINKKNANYASATKTPDPVPEKPTTDNNQNKEKEITVGGKINAGSAKIYGRVGDTTGERQYFSKDPVYTVLAVNGDWIKVRHHKASSGVSGWFKKGDVKAYAKGTLGTKKDELAWIDEMGLEELVMHAGPNGRLEYLSKGTSVIPADLTSNLMSWGELDPQDMLDRNRPAIGVHPEVHNTEINIDNSIAELIHIEHCDQNTLPDVEKIVNKALDKHMQNLNNSIRKFAR